jgi:hypothetical protein
MDQNGAEFVPRSLYFRAAFSASQHENKPRRQRTHPSNYCGGRIHDLIMMRFCRLCMRNKTSENKSAGPARGAAIWAAEIHTLFRTGTHDLGSGEDPNSPDEIIDLSARQMAKAAMAFEQIVDAYVRLKDGRALLDLRAIALLP